MKKCNPEKQKPCKGVIDVFQHQNYDAKGLHVVNTLNFKTFKEGVHLAYMTDSKGRKGVKYAINFCPFCGVEW